ERRATNQGKRQGGLLVVVRRYRGSRSGNLSYASWMLLVVGLVGYKKSWFFFTWSNVEKRVRERTQEVWGAGSERETTKARNVGEQGRSMVVMVAHDQPVNGILLWKKAIIILMKSYFASLPWAIAATATKLVLDRVRPILIDLAS
ncbi:unnamed protein product, partial [Ectocarpus sp. 12 AP-2014]